ncbi:desmoglein-2-like [Megalops cyprinoides]|uniref:desmoglein-2-like n=1 Tax=Megalops cyprinoides TaxID=118141 RepID=UPI001863A3B3|nr:desmoglein-2-like [Megalops cyprinoides]
MDRTLSASVFLLLLHLLTVSAVKVDAGELKTLRRQKREWILPPQRLQENVDYTGKDFIAKIRSDEEVRTSIVYSLTGKGADEPPVGVFTVDPQNGKVRVTRILDREEIPFYHLKGVAMFRNNTRAEKDIDLRIIVVDQNDNDPVFSFGQQGEVNESSQAATLVMTVTATDADDPQTPNAQIAYSIVGQEPGGQNMFYINQETGQIYVQSSALDRETQSSYTLIIKGTDMNGAAGGRTGTGSVVINILDVNDNYPTLEKSHYEGSVEENTANVEIMRIKALDADLMYTENWLAYFSIISGNEAGYFSITTDEKTNEGILVLNKAVDYELLKELDLEIAVNNKAPYHPSISKTGAGKTYPIKIKVKNQPEGPMFKPKVKAFRVSEDSKTVAIHSVIGRYAAIDGDTLQIAENVRYLKGYDPDNWLIIDEKTAEIKLNKLPDRESTFLTNGTYTAKMVCITNDLPSKTATGTIVIQVEDLNDHCPTLTSTSQSACASNPVMYVTAVDEDAAPNGAPFTFTVLPEGTKEKWAVEPLNDTTAILRAHDHLWPGSYRVAVEIKDQQGKACLDEQVLDVMVCTCEDGEGVVACGNRETPSAVFGAPGLGLLLLGLLLLLLVPLLLLFCTCGGAGAGAFKSMPFDTKEHLIAYHTEGQGEDKEVPLLKMPEEVDGARDFIKMGHVGALGAEAGYGGAGMAGIAGAGAGFTSSLSHSERGMWAGYGGRVGGEGREASAYSRFEVRGACDGIALPGAFLEEYYSQKASATEQFYPHKDGLLIYNYEGQESPVGSVGCCSLLEEDNDLEFLNDLGPKFKTLAEICRGSMVESEVTPAPPVPKVDVGAVSMTRTEVSTGSTLAASKVDSTASVAPSAHMQESVVTERSYTATSVPGVHFSENVVVPNQTYLIQPQPVYLATVPVLQAQHTVLVSERPSLQGLYVVSDVPRPEGVVIKEERVAAGPMVHSGVNVGENVVLVERKMGSAHVVREGEAGLNQGLLQVGSLPRSQNVLVVERQVIKEGQSGPAHGSLQRGSLLGSQDLLSASVENGRVLLAGAAGLSGESSEEIREESVSAVSGLQSEAAVLQVAAPPGGHNVVVQEKTMFVSERSMQEVTTG